MWGTRPIEGLYHFLVLTGLLLHFLEDFQTTNGIVHLSWLVALFYGASIEGIRMPQLVVTIPFLIHLFVYVIGTSFYSENFRSFGVI